jgi:putative endonuclease
MKGLHYFVYIITKPNKTVLYTGVTNDLAVRLEQHYQNRANKATFAGKYHCYKLLYFETFSGIEQAISRENEIKGWTRAKKEALIASLNPN